MAAILLGVLAAASWSFHDLIARSFAARIGPFRMALGVMIAGGVLMTAVVVWRATVWTAPAAGVGHALWLGAAYGFGVAGLFKAFSLGPVSLVGPLTAMYPALVVLWNLAQGFSPTGLQWLAMAAALAGAVVVARSGHADGGINSVPRKDLLPLFGFCLLAALGYAASVVLGQDAGAMIGEYEATWVSRATSGLVLLPFLVTERRPFPLQARHWLGILAMAGLDVAGLTAINASGLLPEHEFAAIGISAYGGIAVVLAALVLKERVSKGQWAGIAMIVGGVGLLSAS